MRCWITVQYYTYLFSLWNVWMIEFTVVLPIFGCTLWPASAIVRPWLTTWSTTVALISLGICLCIWPLLPLPLFCPLPLPPRILTPLPRCWPSISVSQNCRNGTHYVLLGSYMLAKLGFMGFIPEWLWTSGLSLVTTNTSHTSSWVKAEVHLRAIVQFRRHFQEKMIKV